MTRASQPLGSGLTVDELSARQGELRAGLDALAALVSGDRSLDDQLGAIAAAAQRAIPLADGTGAALLQFRDSTTRVQALGASHPFVSEIDAIQYEFLDEGPCITAALDGQTVTSGSLGSDDRWPRFGARVSRLGVHSVLSLPMRLPDDTVVGALNAYSHERDAFDADAARIGEVFARPASVATHNAQMFEAIRAQAEQLHTAMQTRAVIDQAIGIVRSRSGISADEAFERLRETSQTENVRLAVVAERIVEEAVRRALARHGTPDAQS